VWCSKKGIITGWKGFYLQLLTVGYADGRSASSVGKQGIYGFVIAAVRN